MTGLARIGAVLLGCLLLVGALLASVGTVALVPIGMWIGAIVSRHRGYERTIFYRWAVGVGPFAVAMVVGFTTAVTVGPLRRQYHDVQAVVDSVQRQPQHPAQLPAFLRQYQTPQPISLPRAVSGPLQVVGEVLGLETMSLVLCTMAWGALTLIGWGVRRPRAPLIDGVTAP